MCLSALCQKSRSNQNGHHCVMVMPWAAQAQSQWIQGQTAHPKRAAATSARRGAPASTAARATSSSATTPATLPSAGSKMVKRRGKRPREEHQDQEGQAQDHGASSKKSKISTIDELMHLKVAELKAFLKERGLGQPGNKEELFKTSKTLFQSPCHATKEDSP